MASAIKVFSRKGIASAGHADLAADAGVSVPTVFSYFPTRVALVVAVIDEVEQFIFSHVRLAMAPCQTAQEQLTASLRAFAGVVETNLEYPKIWVDWSTCFHEKTWPLYQQSVDKIIQFHHEIITAGLKRGEPLQDMDPQIISYMFSAAATAFVQMKLQGRDARSINRCLEMTMRGVMGQPTEVKKKSVARR